MSKLKQARLAAVHQLVEAMIQHDQEAATAAFKQHMNLVAREQILGEKAEEMNDDDDSDEDDTGTDDTVDKDDDDSDSDSDDSTSENDSDDDDDDDSDSDDDDDGKDD